jgi:hypothetical protein
VIIRGGLGLKEAQLFVSSSTEVQATFVVGQTSGTNYVSLVLAHSGLLIVLAQVHPCSKFDLTLGVIPSVWVASSRSLYFYMLYNVLPASSKLIGI